MTTRLEEMLRRAKTEVARDRNTGLSFAARKELLTELGPVLPARDAVGPGLARRCRLCIAVVGRYDVPTQEVDTSA
jgi:hypothetical protein